MSHATRLYLICTSNPNTRCKESHHAHTEGSRPLRTPDGILDLVFNGRTQREHGAVEPLWLIVDVRDFPGWVWQVLQSESQLLGGLERRIIAEAWTLGKAGRRTQWGGRIMHERLCQIDSGKQAAAGQPQRQ